MKDVSVIVITYNRCRLLSQCIHSLATQDYDRSYEILVVDDGSTDDTQKVVRRLQKQYPMVRSIKRPHRGYASARNCGLEHVNGKIIAFIDDDCVAPPDWLTNIRMCFNKKRIDVIGGPVVNPTNRYIAWASYLLNFSSSFPEPRDRESHNLPTTNVAYRASKIRGYTFDTTFDTTGYEDSVFNFTLWKAGRRMWFCHTIPIAHYAGFDHNGIRKFFTIQKRSSLGFIVGGYRIYGRWGELLAHMRFLNLFCPHLPFIFVRCLRSGYLLRFLYHLPLLVAGEFYKGICMLNAKRVTEVK